MPLDKIRLYYEEAADSNVLLPNVVDSLDAAALDSWLNQCTQKGFDGLVLPVDSRLGGTAPPRDSKAYELSPLVQSDLVLPSQTWNSCIAFAMSPWLALLGDGSHHPGSSDKGGVEPSAAGAPSIVEPTNNIVFDEPSAPGSHGSIEPSPGQRVEPPPCPKTDTEMSQEAGGLPGATRAGVMPPPCCCPPDDLAEFCAEALARQLSWASHCGALAALLPAPSLENSQAAVRYAAAVARALGGAGCTQALMKIPLVAKGDAGKECRDGWMLWRQLHALVGGTAALGVALELTPEVPSEAAVVERWLAEPVKAVVIPDRAFVRTAVGAPALPKTLRGLLKRLMRLDLQLIVIQSSGQTAQCHAAEIARRPSVAKLSADRAESLAEAVRRVWRTLTPLSEGAALDAQYFDYLQVPLQPLRDNLESQTYETFERDTTKYSKYEEAVFRCLRDRIAQGRSRHSLIVVGAGRGPLVVACLSAIARANLAEASYSVTAVEKNANAVITLNNRALSQQSDCPLSCTFRNRARARADPRWRNVTIAGADMRYYEPSERADILVSELLGSFGDNELSPECLDGRSNFRLTVLKDELAGLRLAADCPLVLIP